MTYSWRSAKPGRCRGYALLQDTSESALAMIVVSSSSDDGSWNRSTSNWSMSDKWARMASGVLSVSTTPLVSATKILAILPPATE